MKTKRALIILIGLTLTFSVGILAYSQMGEIQPKMLLIYGLIGLVAIISILIAVKKMQEEKEKHEEQQKEDVDKACDFV
ncbi:MAG: hypothetical protein QF371_02775 [Flavobacteriales bacterium]|nr:hypothetical protein [Flavobacteriales bacterium]